MTVSVRIMSAVTVVPVSMCADEVLTAAGAALGLAGTVWGVPVEVCVTALFTNTTAARLKAANTFVNLLMIVFSRWQMTFEKVELLLPPPPQRHKPVYFNCCSGMGIGIGVAPLVPLFCCSSAGVG